jgi:hypothetical protein
MPPGKVYWQRQITVNKNRIDSFISGEGWQKYLEHDGSHIRDPELAESARMNSIGHLHYNVGNIYRYIFNDEEQAKIYFHTSGDYVDKSLPYYMTDLQSIHNLRTVSQRYKWIGFQYWRCDNKRFEEYLRKSIEYELIIGDMPEETKNFGLAYYYRIALLNIFLNDPIRAKENITKYLRSFNVNFDIDNIASVNKETDQDKAIVFLIKYKLENDKGFLQNANKLLEKETRSIRTKDIDYFSNELYLYELCQKYFNEIRDSSPRAGGWRSQGPAEGRKGGGESRIVGTP